MPDLPRFLPLMLLLAGCGAAKSRTPGHSLDGFLSSGGDDLAGADLAGGDLAGRPAGDLAILPGSDLAAAPGSDLAAAPGSDLAHGALTPGDTCATAMSLSAGVLYDDQDTTGLTDDYHIGALSNGTCNTNNNVYKAPDAAYTILVPAGKTLPVTLTPQNIPTLWDPALAIVADCADGATCLAGHDDTNLAGADEVVSWQNSGGTDRAVFVIVDSYFQSMDNYGRYLIRADLL